MPLASQNSSAARSTFTAVVPPRSSASKAAASSPRVEMSISPVSCSSRTSSFATASMCRREVSAGGVS
jgi:hypothetical protein